MKEDIKQIKSSLQELETERDDIQLRCIKAELELSIENVLNELERLQDDNQGYQRILDIFDKRKYRKKYLEEERAKRPRMLYPDADEIYKRYYDLKTANELAKKTIKNHCANMDKVNNMLAKLKKDNYKLDRENQLLFEAGMEQTQEIYDLKQEIEQLKSQNVTYEVDDKEVSNALHMLLHCSLKDTEYVTQIGQFNIVSKYIKQLETENQQLKKGINSLMKSRKKWKDRYYKLKTENSNISRELIHRTDELNKLLEENELTNNTINELLQKAGCIDNDNTVVCKSFQCALYGAEAYVKMKNKEYIEQINKLQKAKEELVVLFEGRLKSIVETSYIPKQVIRDLIEDNLEKENGNYICDSNPCQTLVRHLIDLLKEK